MINPGSIVLMQFVSEDLSLLDEIDNDEEEDTTVEDDENETTDDTD